MTTDSGRAGNVADPDASAIAIAYVRLALRLDQHLPGFVDGYFGPPALKAQVDLEALPSLNRLATDAAELRIRVEAEVGERRRRTWLIAQLRAIEANARALDSAPGGLTGTAYLDHVEQCFDWLPVRRPPELFAAARAEVDRLLPGPGPAVERLAAWDAGLVISPDRLRPVVDWLVERFRERARTLFGLPGGEGLRIALVRDQPWGGYNWYDGRLQSRFDLNTDLPIRAPELIGLVAHETYPGHHLEHAWKESRLVDGEGRLECSVLLINTPECLLSEGLADLGRQFAVPPEDEQALLEELLERAAIKARDGGRTRGDLAATAIALGAQRRRLREFDVNAALRRHVDGADHATVRSELEQVALFSPERAEKTLEFIEDPLWRTYIHVYSEGEALLRRWLEAVPPADQAARFRRLLTEQLSPAMIVAELGT
jgi:hypothetical protein